MDKPCEIFNLFASLSLSLPDETGLTCLHGKSATLSILLVVCDGSPPILTLFAAAMIVRLTSSGRASGWFSR